MKLLESLIAAFRSEPAKDVSATRQQVFLMEELLPLVWSCVRAPPSSPKHLLHVQTLRGGSQAPEQIEGQKSLLVLYKQITAALQQLLEQVSPNSCTSCLLGFASSFSVHALRFVVQWTFGRE